MQERYTSHGSKMSKAKKAGRVVRSEVSDPAAKKAVVKKATGKVRSKTSVADDLRRIRE
ncbi:MAG: hypothetical protein ACRDVM_03510 [Acidimicrobiia bacterium]